MSHARGDGLAHVAIPAALFLVAFSTATRGRHGADSLETSA